MRAFHINPETGDPGVCSAKVQCRFGGESQHYSSAEEARGAYELQNSSSFYTVSKNDAEAVENTEYQETLERITDEIRSEAFSLAEYMADDEALPSVTPPDDSLYDEEGFYYVQSMDAFRDPEFAMNRCQDAAFAVEEYTQRAGFINGVLETIHVKVEGTYLNQHTANLYTDEEDREWIVDYAYSQIDSNADFPYVGLRSDWERSLHRAAENPDPKVREIYERNAIEK